MPAVSRRPVLGPSVPFAVHTADGQTLDVSARGQDGPGAAFRLADPDLAEYVILDFGASRHVRLELDGQVLAEASRTVLLFETMLPVRSYLPREAIRAELTPSSTQTYCAYKGQASYWSATVGGRVIPDLAWTYADPLHDAAPGARRWDLERE